jgi:hypothetical protein
MAQLLNQYIDSVLIKTDCKLNLAMKNVILILLPYLVFISCSWAQLPQTAKTANDSVKHYTGHFHYGSNMGYYPPYTDEQLADIAEQAGVNTLRTAFYEHFAETWGYDARIKAFQHYDSLAMTDNVLFLGYPSAEHRDKTIYCGHDTSALFANMYEPIWDKGENGTPINEKNFYALYVYKTVKQYGKSIRFYEIWNEPDFNTALKTDKTKDVPSTWWIKNPEPCEYTLHAPVQHYIRLLRISYEVIKTLDKEAYVCLGGIGFPSFLDVILRQTDNPIDGSVTPQYPLRGGAYFDVVSYHSYPHIDNSVQEWSDKTKGFQYFRHSDRAVEGVYNRKLKLEEVLRKYGYEGSIFPKKHFIITKSNIPAKQLGDFMGSYEAQRNFVMKALMKAQENNVLQFHINSLGELAHEKDMRNEFELMGLYKKLAGEKPYMSSITPSGIAYRSMSKVLNGYRFDKQETEKLNLPTQADGGAFKQPETGDVIYCLWAKTTKDQSEEAELTYSFPFAEPEDRGDSIANVAKMKWDYSQIGDIEVFPINDVKLNGTPSFFYQTEVIEKAFHKDEPIAHSYDEKKGEITITYKTLYDGQVDLKIFSVEKKDFIGIYDKQPLVKGFHQRKLSTKDWKDGLYVIQMMIDKKPYTKKMLIGKPK